MKKKAQRLIHGLLATLFLVASIFAQGIVKAYAHNAMLGISYDPCIALENADGLNETWYILEDSLNCNHIDDEILTIKYYFEPYSEDGNYQWETYTSQLNAKIIKIIFANSMKKWNNVYFYSYDSAGNIEKKQVINVIEGSAEDHNLSIYPKNGIEFVTKTESVNSANYIETNYPKHKHYNEWKMNVSIDYFFVHTSCPGGYEHTTPRTAEFVAPIRSGAGAREIGKILGLLDVDSNCSSSSSTIHHHEILMGTDEIISNKAIDISYKDIAGVAITRGFHTDADHKWLFYGQDGIYNKLICSICNGVKMVSSLDGYPNYNYGSCNGNHELSSGNMMAVASYGDKDYYKCKYCRYVAPFDSKIAQDYSYEQHTVAQHKVTNDVTGLNYTFYEEHDYVNNTCTKCNAVHSHSYGIYKYTDNYIHTRKCACGLTQTERHYVLGSEIVDGRYAICLGCLAQLDLLTDVAGSVLSPNTQVSVNGSYILPSGIVILVEEDIEAYENGTLQFYNQSDLPSVS